MSKRRISISDHGTFTLFGKNISLPAIIELEDDQIEYIKNTGLYHISEPSASQLAQAKPTPLSDIEGDRFDRARTLSVNELSFRAPIMGTQFKEKAKNAIVVKRNSIYAKTAISEAEKLAANQDKKADKKSAPKVEPKKINTKTADKTKKAELAALTEKGMNSTTDSGINSANSLPPLVTE